LVEIEPIGGAMTNWWSFDQLVEVLPIRLVEIEPIGGAMTNWWSFDQLVEVLPIGWSR
jgi:hypothetical protein